MFTFQFAGKQFEVTAREFAGEFDVAVAGRVFPVAVQGGEVIVVHNGVGYGARPYGEYATDAERAAAGVSSTLIRHGVMMGIA